MKRLGKIKAIVMIMMMTVGISSSIHATTATTELMAQVLYDLGLFSGISNTEFVPDLDSFTNREQAAKMVVVALSLDVDMAAVSPFSDVSAWAQPYVATAVSAGITNGISETSFGAEESITTRQLYTWFDRLITGSETAWEDNAALDNSYGLKRGDLVTVTFEFLQLTPSGSDMSLIQSIVADDETLTTIAIEGGLIAPDPALDLDENRPARIRAVDVVENDRIVITLTNALDEVSAEDESNYRLYTGSGQVKDPFGEIELTAVNEVTVDFKDTLSGAYIIVIEGVKDALGIMMDEYQSFQVGDSRGIFKIEVIDDNKVIVTFTVDLDEASAENSNNYQVTDDDGDEVAINRIRMTGDKEVTITFDDNLNQGDVYSLIIDGVEDDNGKDLDDSEDFVGNETIEAIRVTGSKDITVRFSNHLDKVSAVNNSNYVITDDGGNKWVIEDVDLIDDDEVTITLEDYLNEGRYSLSVEGLKDVDGSVINDKENFFVE